jgi:hypothetical protein
MHGRQQATGPHMLAQRAQGTWSARRVSIDTQPQKALQPAIKKTIDAYGGYSAPQDSPPQLTDRTRMVRAGASSF